MDDENENGCSCPVCYEPCTQKLERCPHILCSSCKSKLETNNCPVCREPLYESLVTRQFGIIINNQNTNYNLTDMTSFMKTIYILYLVIKYLLSDSQIFIETDAYIVISILSLFICIYYYTIVFQTYV